MTAIHHPTPVNQFYRLDRDTPTGPLVKTSRWNHQHVINGVLRNFDGVLCMAGEGAVALDAHTLGASRSSPGKLHDFQDDRSGGIGVTDVDVAWHRGWSQDLLTPDWYNWNDIIYAVRVQRRHAVIAVDYDYVPYEYQVQKDGSFDHAIGIDDFRASDSRILRYDTLDTKAVWTPQSAYRTAAEQIALRIRGTKERLFVGLTKTRPLIVAAVKYRVACTGGTAHPTGLWNTPYGSVVSRVSVATYICTRHSSVNPATGKAQWWYKIVSGGAGQSTDNAGLWISPTRYTKVSYA